MKIPIEFDTGSSYYKLASFLFGIAFASLALKNIESVDQLITCHHSVLRSKFPNLTSADSELSCNVYYDICVCSAKSRSFSRSINCLSSVDFIFARISTPIMFVSASVLLWYTFSFSKSCPRVFVFFSRILFIVILIGIIIGVRSNACYHYCIVVCLFVTLAVLIFVFVISRGDTETFPYTKSRFFSNEDADFT